MFCFYTSGVVARMCLKVKLSLYQPHARSVTENYVQELFRVNH